MLEFCQINTVQQETSGVRLTVHNSEEDYKCFQSGLSGVTMAPPEQDQEAPPDYNVLRRNRKSALTRHLGGVAHLVAEEKVAGVKEKLDVLARRGL